MTRRDFNHIDRSSLGDLLFFSQSVVSFFSREQGRITLQHNGASFGQTAHLSQPIERTKNYALDNSHYFNCALGLRPVD